MDKRLIFSRKLFLYLLDLEVKRARRYQNFFSVLNVKLSPLPGHTKGKELKNCYQVLSRWLIEEMRDSDILGSLGDDQLAVILPYADQTTVNHSKLFASTLEYIELKKKGYNVKLQQINFPKDGADTPSLVKKLIGTEKTK